MRTALPSLSALLLLAATACSDSSSPSAPEAPAIEAPRAVVVSGDAQEATVGAEAADTLAVQFTSASGAPLSGVAVTWSATDGAVAQQTSTTDERGIARTTFTAGTRSGYATAKATANGVDASFTVRIVAGEPAGLEAMAMQSDTVAVDGAFHGAPVRVFDAYRNTASGGTIRLAIYEGDAEDAATSLALQADDAGAVRVPFALTSAAGRYRIVYTAGETSLTYTLTVRGETP